jgi:hypothetical protein
MPTNSLTTLATVATATPGAAVTPGATATPGTTPVPRSPENFFSSPPPSGQSISPGQGIAPSGTGTGIASAATSFGTIRAASDTTSASKGLFVAVNFDCFPVTNPRGWADTVWFNESSQLPPARELRRPPAHEPRLFYRLTPRVYAALLARLRAATEAAAQGQLSAERLHAAEQRFEVIRCFAEAHLAPQDIDEAIQARRGLPSLACPFPISPQDRPQELVERKPELTPPPEPPPPAWPEGLPELVVWFRQAQLPAVPFDLTPCLRVEDPEVFYAALRRELAECQAGVSARSLALAAALRHLRHLAERGPP